jgi:hypothetical protein
MPLDIGVGLFLGVVWSLATGTDLPISIGLGAFFALFPDIDFVVQMITRRSLYAVDHTHRDLLHYPLPVIVGGALCMAVIAPSFAGLFVLGVFWHFLHDSCGVGWGIPWLAPFSERYLKAFSRPDGTFSWKLHQWWLPHERDEVIACYHNPVWIRAEYGSLSKTVLLEVLGFVLLLVVIGWILW